jgi:RNA polymerase sigma-70 factor, ECF subfamily
MTVLFVVLRPVDTLDRLFRLYHLPLVRYLTRRLGDRDWAEEIAQETFLRAARQETLTSERSWLFAVATNLVRDEARKASRQRRHLELLANEVRDDVTAALDETMEREEDRARERQLARAALETLSERDAQALLMREEGLDYDEIAAALGLERSSVGTTLSRARRRLAESYDSARRMRDAREGTRG